MMWAAVALGGILLITAMDIFLARRATARFEEERNAQSRQARGLPWSRPHRRSLTGQQPADLGMA